MGSQGRQNHHHSEAFAPAPFLIVLTNLQHLPNQQPPTPLHLQANPSISLHSDQSQFCSLRPYHQSSYIVIHQINGATDRHLPSAICDSPQ